jgi:hypothetical protein
MPVVHRMRCHVEHQAELYFVLTVNQYERPLKVKRAQAF